MSAPDAPPALRGRPALAALLAHIEAAPGSSLTTLAGVTRKSIPTIQRQVGRLEDLNLVHSRWERQVYKGRESRAVYPGLKQEAADD